MNGARGIPVKIPTRASAPADTGADGVSPLVGAILHEIADHLEALVREGTGGAIDLRGLPLMDTDRAQLHAALGTGEVRASIEVLGPSEIVEAAIPGVWWITHRDEAGRIAAELLEITTCPEILGATTEDVRDGLAALRKDLAAHDLSGSAE